MNTYTTRPATDPFADTAAVAHFSAVTAAARLRHPSSFGVADLRGTVRPPMAVRTLSASFDLARVEVPTLAPAPRGAAVTYTMGVGR